MKYNQQKLPRFNICHFYSFLASIASVLLAIQVPASPTATSNLPSVSITGTRTNASETLPMMSSIDPALIQIQRTGSTQNTLEVKYEITGTAKNGVDYKALSGIATIPAGKQVVQIEVLPITDMESEPLETVILTLKTSSTYNLVTPKSVTVYIQNRDMPSTSAAKITITKPTNQTKFKAPADITIEADAVDPNGYISSLEFYANSEKIGESRLYFFVAPKPGTVINHAFTWKNVPIGTYKIYAKATDSKGISVQSDSIEISVVSTVELPGVMVMATDSIASENRTNIGVFTFTKFGALDSELKVNYSVSGTASNGVDYALLPGQIIIPKGTLSTNLVVTAIDDTIRETNETVIVSLKPNELYSILYPSNAIVTLQDNDMMMTNQPPLVSIIRPTNNTVLINPTNLVIAVEAIDKETYVAKLEFIQDGVSLGTIAQNSASKSNIYEFRWSNPPVGTHLVTVKATDSQGLSSTSSSVKVIIKSSAATLAIVNPQTGAKYPAPANIAIDASAVDPAGAITKVTFYSGDKEIGVSQVMFIRQPEPGTLVKHAFTWTNVAIGTYSLTVKGYDTAGKQVVSPAVSISVTGVVARVVAERILPETYNPGTTLMVKTKITIPPTTSYTVYAVEEKPPTNWAVKEISDNGVWDAVSGKVKWGPFFEGSTRILSYAVTPPTNSTGIKEFTGMISLDGVSTTIGGAKTIKKLVLLYHPADKSPADWNISLDELTSYIFLWKKEKTIPQSYVTQAELIWRKSGLYKYLTDGTVPPKCWEPITTIKATAIASDGLPDQSNLLIRSFGDDILILFIGTPGQEYTIEATKDLNDWIPLTTLKANEAGFLEWIDAKALSNKNLFYRVR